MNHTRRRLPGGRGLYSGDEAFIDQGESFSGRRGELPQQDGFLITNVGVHTELAGQTFTANRLHLMLMNPPRLDRDTFVQHGRLCVSTLDAGSTAKTAIYRYDQFKKRAYKVPVTEQSYSSASTGVKTSRMARQIALRVEGVYLFGFKASSAVAAFSGLGSTRHIAVRTRDDSDMTMPNEVVLSTTTQQTTIAVPAISYFATLFEDVL